MASILNLSINIYNFFIIKTFGANTSAHTSYICHKLLAVSYDTNVTPYINTLYKLEWNVNISGTKRMDRYFDMYFRFVPFYISPYVQLTIYIHIYIHIERPTYINRHICSYVRLSNTIKTCVKILIHHQKALGCIF